MKAHTTSLMVCCLVLAVPVTTCAQVETVFNEVHFYEPLKIVHEKVKAISETTQLIVVDKTIFPLAREKEEHLVCTDVKTKGGIVSKIVFTFADDKLASIEAKGNAVESLISSRKDTAVNYLHYKAFPAELLVGDPQEDRVWMLTKESGHLNLFTWNNPYLSSKRPVPKYEPSAKIPVILIMGGHIDELTPILKRGSVFMNIEALDGSDPNAQTQINCFGGGIRRVPQKARSKVWR